LHHNPLELLGVTTVFGNCPPALGARSAAAVLRAAGCPDIPVAIGMGTNMAGGLPQVLIEAYAGQRGRPGQISLPELPNQSGRPHAVDLIIDLVRRHPSEVTIVAIGPQTNLALALLKEPRIKDQIASIVFMGGALGLNARFGRGNITPVAECNIWFDPAAADIVFRSGIDLTMVSLDVTNPSSGMLMPEETVRAVDERRSPLAALFVEVCSTYLEAPMFDWGHGCVLYDPLAVAVTAEPALGTFESMAVGIETAGRLSLGQTVPLRDLPPNVRVMTSVDGRRVVDAMVKTILS
jgi:purine nucleosidase